MTVCCHVVKKERVGAENNGSDIEWHRMGGGRGLRCSLCRLSVGVADRVPQGPTSESLLEAWSNRSDLQVLVFDCRLGNSFLIVFGRVLGLKYLQTEWPNQE